MDYTISCDQESFTNVTTTATSFLKTTRSFSTTHN